MRWCGQCARFVIESGNSSLKRGRTVYRCRLNAEHIYCRISLCFCDKKVIPLLDLAPDVSGMTLFPRVQTLGLLLLSAAVLPGLSQRVSNTQSIQGSPAGSVCGINAFRCESGQCIASDKVCDGRAHCQDASDETAAVCSSTSFVCPTYAFRCAYGACVDGDAPCNGRQDCHDNSDELLASCQQNSNNGNSNSGNSNSNSNNNGNRGCSPDSYRCKNGQCISDSLRCDGTVNCGDGSDETPQLCRDFSCPDVAFKCAYGACVDGDYKCNGVRNCADGSDEDTRICSSQPTRKPPTTSDTAIPAPRPPGRRPTTSTTSRPIYRPPQQTTSTTQASWLPPPISPRRSCPAPQQPANGYWKLHESQCPYREECDVAEGVLLDPGSHLVYRCYNGYRLNGTPDATCGSEGKWINTPTCSEIRCKPLSSAALNANCKYRGEWASCGGWTLPETVATLSCRNSYRQTETTTLLQRDVVTCNSEGKWEPEPIKCVPDCGIVSPPANPLVVNGELPEVTEFPWHATLYRAENSRAPKKFFCGATIIRDNLLVTAAHCVYDVVNKRLDRAKFYVATGNIYRDYDSPDHDEAVVKKGEVKKIYLQCNYLGFDGNYEADIALLELVEPFKFSNYLVPACLDNSAHRDVSELEVGDRGKVAGFGRTATGGSSYILQSLVVPYVSQKQCKTSGGPNTNEKFLTIDKFCAGYTNGSAVCNGDSGGGLVFENNKLWYLRGVVSVGLGAKTQGGSNTCDSNTYSLYTRVSKHMDWINEVIFHLESGRVVPTCPNTRLKSLH